MSNHRLAHLEVAHADGTVLPVVFTEGCLIVLEHVAELVLQHRDVFVHHTVVVQDHGMLSQELVHVVVFLEDILVYLLKFFSGCFFQLAASDDGDDPTCDQTEKEKDHEVAHDEQADIESEDDRWQTGKDSLGQDEDATDDDEDGQQETSDEDRAVAAGFADVVGRQHAADGHHEDHGGCGRDEGVVCW